MFISDDEDNIEPVKRSMLHSSSMISENQATLGSLPRMEAEGELDKQSLLISSQMDEEKYYLEVDEEYTDVNKSSDISCAGFLRALGPASSQFTESSKKNFYRPDKS